MNINFTARHFKARPELQQQAENAVNQLATLYDGIVTADIVLEEEPHGAGRMAEMSLLVFKDKLFAREKSNDFTTSINACIEKIERQLRRYKDKLREGEQPHDTPPIADVVARSRADRDEE